MQLVSLLTGPYLKCPSFHHLDSDRLDNIAILIKRSIASHAGEIVNYIKSILQFIEIPAVILKGGRRDPHGIIGVGCKNFCFCVESSLISFLKFHNLIILAIGIKCGRCVIGSICGTASDSKNVGCFKGNA